MKTILTIALLFFQVLAFTQGELSWGDTLSVVNDISKGNLRPKIGLTRNDIPIVMWAQSNGAVFTSRFENGEFTTPLKVTPEGMNTYSQSWVGPDMVAESDTVYVTFKSIPEGAGYVYIVKSTDGGLTFGDTVRVSNDVWSRFPSLGIRPDGNPIVTYMQFDSAYHDPRYVVCNSTDWGATFDTPSDATELAPGESCDCCPGFVIGTNDETYSLFRNNDNNLRDLWATKASNIGGAFSTAMDIDNNDWIINSCPSTGPDAVLIGDSVYAVWMSGASGFSRVNIATRDKSTLASGVNREMTPESTANQNYPKIAGDENVIGITWQESDAWDLNIRFNWSRSGMSGFTEEHLDTVNLDFDGVQSNPDITYASGVFHIIWQDDNDKSVKYRSAKINDLTTVRESTTPNGFEVKPNPTSDFLYLEFTETPTDRAELLLHSTTGHLVYKALISNKQETPIDISGIAPGVYYFSLSTGTESYRKKIIISR